MSEQRTKDLAAHLACLLTTAEATIHTAKALADQRRPAIDLIRHVSFRSMVDDVANAHQFLAEMAVQTGAVADRAQADSLFPSPPDRWGIPDIHGGGQSTR